MSEIARIRIIAYRSQRHRKREQVKKRKVGSVGSTRMDLRDLSEGCAQESQDYLRGQDNRANACFELFRRAFVERDQGAWTKIFLLFEPQVTRWVTKHPSFPHSQEEAQYFANRAFEKMWASIDAAKFARFNHISGLLRYLKMCTASVIIDHVRTREKLRPASWEDLEQSDQPESVDVLDHFHLSGPGEPVEDAVFARLEAQELWQLLLELVADSREQRVLYASFMLGLKPRQVFEHYPGEFDSVDHVYRIKENLLARLKRNPELAGRFSPGAGKTG
jgi:DNA-directed RNA polymerase specialized sigma24 family protein